MKTHTEVAVIGGGIAGCSLLYHLTREGITDCVLIERAELTSGTTWHSAAQVTNFGMAQTSIGLKSHSIKLYKELAEDPEYPINYHYGTGGIRLATTQEHVDGYNHYISMAKGMGVDLEFIDAEECKRRHPLISTEGLLGAMWDPKDGDIDPAQLCQALARRARKAGAEIYRFNPVVDLTQNRDGSWNVVTEKGTIVAEKIVNAGGYRSNEIARMYGVEHPIASMEHQYMVTEPIAGLEDLHKRVPIIRCPTHDFYSRQEKNGLLVGFYEQQCKTWGMDGIDPNFTNALCPDDLDRVTDVMEGIFVRLPCLMDAGIQSVVNGPITYTPDGPPMLGKIPGVRNAYACCGLRIGLGEGGGHGWLLAQIIAHGEACYDTWAMNPARFSPEVNMEYTSVKAVEDYMNEMRFHMPHEHRPMGRPLKTTPLYGRLKELGAEFLTAFEWERADYYKPSPTFQEDYSFRFNNTFDVIAKEAEGIANGVGIAEVGGFGRFEISGKGVYDWLDGLTCSRIPRKPGKIALVYFLNHFGNVRAESTVIAIDESTLWLGTPASAVIHDMEWLREHLPDDGSITIRDLSKSHTMLIVSGPKSAEVLAKACPRTDWSSTAFPWLSHKMVHIGWTPARAIAVSFNGELSWELHLQAEQVNVAFELLWNSGQEFGMIPYGARVTESMRIEKGYRHWKADLITEYNPIESGLDRFVDLSKDFIGKTSLQEMIAAGPRRVFVALEIEANHAPALSGDSIVSNGALIGSVTSGAWGHRVNRNLAMGFVDPQYEAAGTQLEVELLGQPHKVTVVDGCQIDPDNRLVRRVPLQRFGSVN